MKNFKPLILNFKSGTSGFTLIEAIIATAIFAIVAGGVYFSYLNVLEIFAASYLNLTGLSAIDNELETIRNMSYPDIGVQGGVPSGRLVAQKNIIFGGVSFVVETSVRNVDDPFDGTQGGVPNDTSPADYKLVEVQISCPTCSRFIPAKITTTVAPPGLETVTNNGTLIIRAVDASGQAVSGANVSVVNNSVSPAINLNDVTDTDGILKLVDIATSSAGYSITVSKSGYSTDKNYRPGDPLNPNPLKPYATVLEQEVTQASFLIDEVSTLSVRTQDKFCGNVGNINFLQTGQKLIGTNPNVFKYSLVNSTNSSGNLNINNLEFDTYNFSNQSGTYEVVGFTPMPIVVDPSGNYSLSWLMEPKTPSAILVTVQNQNGQLINDAKVTLSRTGFSDVKYTGRNFFSQTDWSGNQYDSVSTYLVTDSPAGELHLGQIGGKYASMSDEWLISRTIDFGGLNTNFYNLIWNPVSQPVQAGINSFKIQFAANNDNSTWNFTGPDGTAGSYYTASDAQLNSVYNGNRYLRYKIILRTEDELYTPQLADLMFYFHSGCIPDGQSYFSGLTQATYGITIEKSGYTTFVDTGVSIDENWKDYRVVLTPQ